MRLDGLPDALREFGVEPVLVAGWQTRGVAFAGAPRIHLRHWTAGSATGKAGSLGIVTYGRGGSKPLPGPLAQVLQERTGGGRLDRAIVVASGAANHAGIGRWEGVTSGNRQGTGNEIEWSGPGESFPGNRIETSERIAAAFQSLNPAPGGKWCCEHREYATPAGRKIDTNLSGSAFRMRVQMLLNDPGDPAMFDADEVKQIEKAVRAALSDGTAPGQTSWGGTNQSILREIKANGTLLDKILLKVDGLPAKVAAALPPGQGGVAPTLAEIQAAVKTVLNAELGFLKPGN